MCAMYVGAVAGIAIGTFVCGVILSATLLFVISSCRYAIYYHVLPCHHTLPRKPIMITRS